MTDKKCGYVALLGKPNAGKSTLLNACLGAKIAVVSKKPQTTRNKILGVLTEGKTQILFLDTPGIHRAESLPQLNKLMNKTAWSVLQDADVACYLIDATAGWKPEDSWYFDAIVKGSKCKIMILASKSDKLKKHLIAEGVATIVKGVEDIIAQYPDQNVRERIVGGLPFEISAKRPEEVEEFRNIVSQYLPSSEWLFPEDDLTDRPQRFICGELIREQLFRQLEEELPYSCAVRIEKFQAEPNVTRISATVIVQKENHKRIVVGRGGSQIRQLGIASREALEQHLGRRVFLELFVKVQENWVDNKQLIAEYAELSDPDKLGG